MATKEALRAVYDEDLASLLRSLGVLNRFEAGTLKCAICGDTITWENLYGIFPEGGDVKFGCTRPACVTGLAARIEARTA